MSRPNDESGLDGLGILEDDLILDHDMVGEPVTRLEADPVRAENHAGHDVVMPSQEADPTGWKRAAFIAACLLVAATGIGFLIYGVATWNH